MIFSLESLKHHIWPRVILHHGSEFVTFWVKIYYLSVTGKFSSKVPDLAINHDFENLSNCEAPYPAAQHCFGQVTPHTDHFDHSVMG